MSFSLRIFLGILSVVLIAAPFSILATILLLPFWSWFEATTGIESVGHSGPAEWCYSVVFLIIAAAAAQPLLARLRRSRDDKHGGEKRNR